MFRGSLGKFDSVDAGKNIDLSQLTLIYADNGRGKTTIATMLRALSTGQSDVILGRQRLGAQQLPEIVIKLGDGSSTAVFNKGAWSKTLDDLIIFDDVFVENNVCSGLVVSPQQRQNLHDVIIGPQAVKLSKQLQDCIDKVKKHNQDLKLKGSAIPADYMGSYSLDAFCKLKVDPNVDKQISELELKSKVALEEDQIASKSLFRDLSLPKFDLEAIEQVLQLDLESLETTTLEKLQMHFGSLGQRGELWVSQGMNYIRDREDEGSMETQCPFCAQNLSQSDLIAHYRAYFSDAYEKLKQSIEESLSQVNDIHGEGNRTLFEHQVREIEGLAQFWSRFCEIKRFSVDTSTIFQDWERAWEAVVNLITLKQKSPLEKIRITGEVKDLAEAYLKHSVEIGKVNAILHGSNAAIQKIKEASPKSTQQEIQEELANLKIVRKRSQSNVSKACDEYLDEKTAKSATEQKRDAIRKQLDDYRKSAFQEYGSDVNRYLSEFSTDFQMQELKHQNLASGSASTYQVKINEEIVEVVKPNPQTTEQSFGNVFSGGDRTTLAFAFFLASLDRDPDLKDKIVVIDDPISSMDSHRTLTTAQIVRKLCSRAKQVTCSLTTNLFFVPFGNVQISQIAQLWRYRASNYHLPS